MNQYPTISCRLKVGIVIFSICLAFMSKASADGENLKTTCSQPPCAWDIRKTNTIAETTLTINKYEVYNFVLKVDIEDRSKVLRRRASIDELLGDASYHRVTPESENSENPVLVPERTEEEMAFMKSGGWLSTKQQKDGKDIVEFRYGSNLVKKTEIIQRPPSVLVLTKKGAGVTIPIRIKIDSINDAGTKSVHLDETVQTKGRITGMERLILSQPLRPGIYRVSVENLIAVTMPDDFRISWDVSWNPKVMPADDWVLPHLLELLF